MHIKSQRIVILDIIRGFALLGILMVNAPSLNTPAYMDTDDFAFQVSPADHAVTKFIFSFAMESFYPIFALLFGIGAAIFLSKVTPGVSKLYLRRLLFLFIIGLFHAFFVWWGDILIIYACLGSFLLYFYTWQPKNILKIIATIFGTISIICLSQALWPSPELLIPKGPDTLLVYSTGNFYDITLQRMHDWVRVFFLNATPLDSFVYFLDMFGIMLLGMWIQKKKILSILEENSKLLILLLLIMFILTIFCNIFPDLIWPLKGLSKGLLYVTILLLITRNNFLRRLLAPLAYNGRMSMTNYLGFNICLSFIFYGYGLGLYGSMGPASQMAIVFVLYFAFLAFSVLWLRYFPYGPFEYIWRMATYGRLPRAKTPSKILTNI